MTKYERFLVYPALILLIILITVQELELRSQFQTLKNHTNAIHSQTEILKLNGERLDLLERMMIRNLMPFSSECQNP